MKKWMVVALALMLSFCLQSPAQAQGQSVHIVKSGDTLWKISKWFQIGLSEIINANPQFENPDLIYPGDKVYIPRKQKIKSIEYEVIKLTNQKRAENGLGPLKADWQLSRVARYKSNDMKNNGYFSHQSPTYGSPFEMMRDFNINYTSAGENIAMGQTSAQAVVDAWMKSPGHRKNILSSNYTYIGVGYAKGGSGRYYWTQMFIRK
ncbi:SafA/ExsA family spore coat assembly protein [Pseudalkalibacillus sp. Hm43]|uniref:SafA/ExsA family spore coat assembly protein n=1 Tax=Pseudalkalibacillus sp. Hm43 TaxID=3450742 RepID=UPI003F43EEE9